MTEALDKLNELRKKKQALIDKAQGEISDWENVVRETSGQLDGIDEAIALLKVGTNGTAQANGTPALIGKYVNMKLTPAVRDVIESAGTPPGLLVPDILKRLQAEGFRSDVKDLYGTVYPVAQRLVKQGKIKEGKRDGKRSFMRKQPF